MKYVLCLLFILYCENELEVDGLSQVTDENLIKQLGEISVKKLPNIYFRKSYLF